ncbi:MAG: hypothetical protein IJ841_07570 [Prevotella sp.]|nr:hypothetical protein [Prevotella sp.]
MAKINLDTEPRFKAMLKQFGFKKRSYQFCRNYGDTIQSVGFGHATNGEKHVRYYSCSYSFEFPKVMEIAKEIGAIPYGTGGLLGYLMPQRSPLVEWRLSEQDSEEYYLSMIQEIVDAIRDYALPFMERYSTLQAYVEGAEQDAFRHGSFDRQCMPIAYYLLGDLDSSMRYIEETLQRYSRGNSPKGIEVIKTAEFEEVIIHPEPDINYVNYLDFSEKFKQWVEQQEKSKVTIK